jgi:hypothetical protein
MEILDAEATFVKPDKLRQRIDRREQAPDVNAGPGACKFSSSPRVPSFD